MREKVFQLAEQYVNSGRKLIRGNEHTCLLAAINASELKTNEDCVEKSARILSCSREEIRAIEAGFEGWGGVSRVYLPEIWQIGADVAKKYL